MSLEIGPISGGRLPFPNRPCSNWQLMKVGPSPSRKKVKYKKASRIMPDKPMDRTRL